MVGLAQTKIRADVTLSQFYKDTEKEEGVLKLSFFSLFHIVSEVSNKRASFTLRVKLEYGGTADIPVGGVLVYKPIKNLFDLEYAAGLNITPTVQAFSSTRLRSQLFNSYTYRGAEKLRTASTFDPYEVSAVIGVRYKHKEKTSLEEMRLGFAFDEVVSHQYESKTGRQKTATIGKCPENVSAELRILLGLPIADKTKFSTDTRMLLTPTAALWLRVESDNEMIISISRIFGVKIALKLLYSSLAWKKWQIEQSLQLGIVTTF